MNIKETFLALTNRTYPFGYEEELISFLPKDHYTDTNGNYFVKIGNSRTAFTCHLDTACKEQVNVVHTFQGDIIATDGKSILGADDKAGMTILLYMIEKNIPGLYCFFYGEEVGCIGSGLAPKDSSIYKDYDRMISFDRRGTDSIITFQSSKRCCSDKFANELANRLNKHNLKMKPDDTGVYTDSAEFTGIISECTNISVGYYKEHTHAEHQDIEHLIRLANAVTKINWETLPTVRKSGTIEWKKWNSSYSSYDYTYTSRGYNSNHSKRNKSHHNSKAYGYHDDWYEEEMPKKSWKKNQVASTKNGRVYLNDLENEITELVNNDFNYYETLRQIIFNDKISADEFEIIKDNYLDMENPADLAFCNEMRLMLVNDF